MKFSEKWLRTWINPPIKREALVAQLTLAGLEVESVTPAGSDAILELSITPNRGDCLSILGVAREISALNNLSIYWPDFCKTTVGARHASPMSMSVTIQSSAQRACPRYIGRAIRNINPAKKTPAWIKERLISGGIDPKMPVVDVLNYVMLELGQPMHAFDLTALSEGIQVRMAKPGEKIILLNDQTVTLQPDTLVIADSLEAHAIAGVMGGLKSAVQADSRDIFLESAFFAPEAIAGQARRYGVHTDSAYRFERGVDFELQERAIEYATTLLLDIVGGEPGKLIQKTSKYLPTISAIKLDLTRVEQVLGIKIPKTEITAMLKSLGLKIKGNNITPPSYRFDIRIPEDLIEEIARLYGYDKIPAVGKIPPSPPFAKGGVKRGDLYKRDFYQTLINRGYREAITYSFVDPKLQKALHPTSENFELANPISPELSVMRVGLWAGLLTALQYNYNRQQSRIRLFETGLYFPPETNQQQPAISGVIIGSAVPEQWGVPMCPADFFDIKSDVEALLALTGHPADFTFEPKARDAFHPQQASCIKKKGREIGWVGQLNPTIQQMLGITEPVYMFELVLKEIELTIKPTFKPLPKFPSVRRDISIFVDKAVSAAELKRAIHAHLLDHILFFDVYEGKGVPAGQKSIALGLIFQDPQRTLTDDAVNVQMAQIIAILQKDLKATLRS